MAKLVLSVSEMYRRWYSIVYCRRTEQIDGALLVLSQAFDASDGDLSREEVLPPFLTALLVLGSHCQ
jgi:hypothetical protein